MTKKWELDTALSTEESAALTSLAEKVASKPVVRPTDEFVRLWAEALADDFTLAGESE